MEAIYQYVVGHEGQLSAIGLGIIMVSRLIAALTPSKTDDAVTGRIEKYFRKGVSLVSGANHVDPSKPAAVPVAPDGESELEAFNRILKQFGAQLQVVPRQTNKGD